MALAALTPLVRAFGAEETAALHPPDNGVRGGTAYGRDHNPNAMTMWLAGGGCNAGHTIGATDELGMIAVEGKARVRDFHVNLLRLLGLDDNKHSVDLVPSTAREEASQASGVRRIL
jgi:hypothetical protein